jgi:hypothetical protein
MNSTNMLFNVVCAALYALCSLGKFFLGFFIAGASGWAPSLVGYMNDICVLGAVLELVLTWFLIRKAFQRRNWARVTLIVFLFANTLYLAVASFLFFRSLHASNWIAAFLPYEAIPPQIFFLVVLTSMPLMLIPMALLIFPISLTDHWFSTKNFINRKPMSYMQPEAVRHSGETIFDPAAQRLMSREAMPTVFARMPSDAPRKTEIRHHVAPAAPVTEHKPDWAALAAKETSARQSAAAEAARREREQREIVEMARQDKEQRERAEAATRQKQAEAKEREAREKALQEKASRDKELRALVEMARADAERRRLAEAAAHPKPVETASAVSKLASAVSVSETPTAVAKPDLTPLIQTAVHRNEAAAQAVHHSETSIPVKQIDTVSHAAKPSRIESSTATFSKTEAVRKTPGVETRRLDTKNEQPAAAAVPLKPVSLQTSSFAAEKQETEAEKNLTQEEKEYLEKLSSWTSASRSSLEQKPSAFASEETPAEAAARTVASGATHSKVEPEPGAAVSSSVAALKPAETKSEARQLKSPKVSLRSEPSVADVAELIENSAREIRSGKPAPHGRAAPVAPKPAVPQITRPVAGSLADEIEYDEEPFTVTTVSQSPYFIETVQLQMTMPSIFEPLRPNRSKRPSRNATRAAVAHVAATPPTSGSSSRATIAPRATASVAPLASSRRVFKPGSSPWAVAQMKLAGLKTAASPAIPQHKAQTPAASASVFKSPFQVAVSAKESAEPLQTAARSSVKAPTAPVAAPASKAEWTLEPLPEPKPEESPHGDRLVEAVVGKAASGSAALSAVSSTETKRAVSSTSDGKETSGKGLILNDKNGWQTASLIGTLISTPVAPKKTNGKAADAPTRSQPDSRQTSKTYGEAVEAASRQGEGHFISLHDGRRFSKPVPRVMTPTERGVVLGPELENEVRNAAAHSDETSLRSAAGVASGATVTPAFSFNSTSEEAGIRVDAQRYVVDEPRNASRESPGHFFDRVTEAARVQRERTASIKTSAPAAPAPRVKNGGKAFVKAETRNGVKRSYAGLEPPKFNADEKAARLKAIKDMLANDVFRPLGEYTRSEKL